MERNVVKKAVLALILAGSILIALLCNLDRYLTLPYIKASQLRLQSLYTEQPALTIAGYMALYVVVTSLSLPGAAVLTLLGGALFGFWTGTLVVSFASSIGATIACSVSRFLLRDWVARKLGDKLKKVTEGIGQEGAFYLFTLRLIPVFPFWVINLVMGLTPMPLYTFYWVSQVGMLCGTAVYVNAGRELAHIDSASGILSPQLIFAFVLLGLFPLIARKLLVRFKAIAVARH